MKIEIQGIPPLSILSFNYPNSQAIATLFTQEMLEKGFLASRAFYATFAHKDEHIDKYAETVNDVFRVISEAISDNAVEKKLKGPIAHSGFRRLA